MRVFTEEHRRKLSESHKGKKFSKETRVKMKLSASLKDKSFYKSPIRNKKISEANRNRIHKSHSEETKRKMSLSRMGHKISDITKKKIGIANKGHKMSLEQREKLRVIHLGSKHTEGHRKKISLAMKGKNTWIKGRTWTEEQRRKMSYMRKGKKQSLETRRKKSLAFRGKKSHWYKDGNGYRNAGLRFLIMRTIEYRDWRSKVFERDSFTCRKCIQKGGILRADHIIPFILIVLKNNITSLEEALNCKELWDIDNGQTLCDECHKLKTREDHKLIKNIKLDGLISTINKNLTS